MGSENSRQKCIIIRKDRQKQSDKKISEEWRYARINFFTVQIWKRLSKANIQEEIKKEIVELLLYSQSTICLDKLGKLQKYHSSIKPLHQQLLAIEQKFQKKLRQCSPMHSIIEKGITNLKLIQIQYQPIINKNPNYSISAFELFKIVQGNQLLTQVMIKGVWISQFQEFVNLLNPSNTCMETNEKSEYLNWIRKFSPSKQLRLTLSAKLNFHINSNEAYRFEIDDLKYFRGLFYWVSDLTASIKLQKWAELSEFTNNLPNFMNQLREIKKIKIQIHGYGEIQTQTILAIRSSLLGGLALFNDIDQILFFRISFNSYKINDFLAIQQSLSIIFENNAITDLNICWCNSFPVFSTTTSLQSIHLNDMSFRKQSGFVNVLVKNNPSLKFIQCIRIDDEWIIDDHLLNKLQVLIIEQCGVITLRDIQHQQSSNINIGSVDSLSMIFPKLANLSYLSINQINIGHYYICNIPSQHLQELHIKHNKLITDQGLKAIDSKWLKLRHVQIVNCQNITENVWKHCKFKKLLNLRVNRKLLGKGMKALPQIKMKGTKVEYY